MPLHPESPIDVLATSRAVLETAKEVSDAVSVVPLLGIVLGAFANLLKAVKDVQGADSRAKRLRQRAVEFRGYIERTVLEHQDAVNTDICTQLSALYETLHDIRKAIENMQKRRFITRLIRKSSISDMLDEHLETLESAWRSFMASCMIGLARKIDQGRLEARTQSTTIQHQVKGQSERAHAHAIYTKQQFDLQVEHASINDTYDKDGYRLFRVSDLRLCGVKGHWYAGRNAIGEEWTGEWQGRTVVVRILQSDMEAADQVDAGALCRQIPRIFHPHVARVLGYSHPTVHERFYVMETGSVPLNELFQTIRDRKALLRVWMQTMLDYKTALEYTNHQQTYQQLDRHSEFSPLWNSALNSDGRLLLDADHLAGGSNLSMYWFWEDGERVHRDGRRRWNGVTLPTLPEEYYNILRQVLAHLTGKQQPSQLGISLKTWKTWRVEKYYYKLPRINLGDFGYYQPGSASDDDDAAVFVRLGNLSELLPSSVSATIIWEYSPPSGTQAHSDSIERYLTCKLPRSRKTHITHGRESSKSLKQECVDYWWDNIFDIASTYGRAVHELILVRDIYEWATAEAVGSCNTHHWCGPSTHMRPDIEKPCLEYKDVPDPGPIDVYFHFNIPQESLPRESREPWGYWSLEPEPSPGPWPKISMPGLSLDQDSLLRCEQLTRLEADLFSHLRDMQEQERCAGDSGVRFAEMGDC